jgi:hypothetical protein
MGVRTRQTSAEWAATVVAPLKAKDAVAKLREAIQYSDDSIDEVMSTLGGGTLPPARAIMPDLYKARDVAVNARNAIQSLADRAPDTEVAPLYITEGKKIGINLIDASNEAMDKAKTPESATKLISTGIQVAERAAATAARGVLKIGEKMLTPMEALLWALILDELLNKGKLRKGILRGR